MGFGGHGNHVWKTGRTYVRRRIVVAAAGITVAIVLGVGLGNGVADLQGFGATTAEEGKKSASSDAKASSTPQSDASSETSADPTQSAVNGINALDGSATISTSGFTLDTDAQLTIEAQVSNFESAGYTASFVLADINTGRAIAYNADAQVYSASAIKAPFIMALASTGTIDLNAVYQAGDTQNATTKQNIDQVLTVSDNTAYRWLVDTYGTDAFDSWASQAGTAIQMAGHGYVTTCARDMAKLWTQGYGFLFAQQTSGAADISDEALQWLSGDMTDSLNSNIHRALGDSTTVYTKAGWISGEGDLYALNDGGIVASSSGTYVLTVMTDACGRNDLLTELVDALDSVHSGAMLA